MLTLGTGVAFAARTEAPNQAENARENSGENIGENPGENPGENSGENPKENTKVSPWITVSFLPNPEVYATYAAFGITGSEDGTKLLYQGQPVRMFVDGKADAEAFYLDEAGSVNLSVVRNAAGEITGMERMTSQKAQEYYRSFFAEELSDPLSARAQDFVQVQETVQDLVQAQETVQVGPGKYDQYQPFGITHSTEDEELYYDGQRVKFLVDLLVDGWFGTLWTDDAGTVNLAVIRDASGQITGIGSISEEEAQAYRAASEANEKHVSDGLEKKIEDSGMEEKIAERLKDIEPIE